jgi:DNA-binding transcriptional LysR family regulator
MKNFHNGTVELRHLRLIKTVASEGSLVRAAPLLHLTQSALSHQLLRIEEAVGKQLFLRTRGRMQLTPTGRRLLTTAENVLNELDAAARDLAAMNGMPAATGSSMSRRLTLPGKRCCTTVELMTKAPSLEISSDQQVFSLGSSRRFR